jgi:hypothetical protein
MLKEGAKSFDFHPVRGRMKGAFRHLHDILMRLMQGAHLQRR